jgi:hypothetical protein
MEDQTNENEQVEIIEDEEVEETPAQSTEDVSELKSRLQRLEEKAITQRERTRLLKQELEKAKKASAPKEAPVQKTGELDETQLDYLDLKGISEQEDIAIIESIVKKTGVTVRQALKDEYVVAKLEANKANRELKAATPSSTKRSSGGQSNDFQAALAKYEATGEYPADFALRSAVVDHLVSRNSPNKPAWHK